MKFTVTRYFLVCALGVIIGFGSMSACSKLQHKSGLQKADQMSQTVVSTHDRSAFSRVMDEISLKRAIFIGETHTNYSHHTNQLAVIREFHERGVDFAVGLEFFQRPFQLYLDAYIDKEIDEKPMLKATKYYKRWRYDYRLYRPILAYAREHGIPLVALNAPTELVRHVSLYGWNTDSAEGHMQLPAIEMEPDQRYKQRLRRVFSMHPMAGDKEFVRFMQVQLLWDEYMAESTADYLQKNPERKIIVLAGSGHLRGGSGIPERLSSRLSLDYAVLLSGQPADYVAGDADLIIVADGLELPKAGLLGIHIQEVETGVIVRRVGAARKQGPGHLSVNDRILSIAGERIRSIEDVRLALLDRLPGEQVWLELERNDELGRVSTVSTYIVLKGETVPQRSERHQRRSWQISNAAQGG